jgi:hypothetical protein
MIVNRLVRKWVWTYKYVVEEGFGKVDFLFGPAPALPLSIACACPWPAACCCRSVQSVGRNRLIDYKKSIIIKESACFYFSKIL